MIELEQIKIRDKKLNRLMIKDFGQLLITIIFHVIIALFIKENSLMQIILLIINGSFFAFFYYKFLSRWAYKKHPNHFTKHQF